MGCFLASAQWFVTVPPTAKGWCCFFVRGDWPGEGFLLLAPWGVKELTTSSRI
jgi:hypothetical protein